MEEAVSLQNLGRKDEAIDYLEEFLEDAAHTERGRNSKVGAGAGRPQISTRIRLSGSQGVIAIAALSDGSYWSATAEVAVTVSACWDAS